MLAGGASYRCSFILITDLYGDIGYIPRMAITTDAIIIPTNCNTVSLITWFVFGCLVGVSCALKMPSHLRPQCDLLDSLIN